MNPVKQALIRRDAKSRQHAPAIVAKARSKAAGPPAPKSGPAPKLSSYAQPRPVAPGPGPTPKPGQLVREGINYKDLPPELQDQMARQAGLTPQASLPPGVTTPAQQQQAAALSSRIPSHEEAGESPKEEASETPDEEAQEDNAEKAKSDLTPPPGHHAVAAHVRKNPVVSKMGAAKLRKRGVNISD